MKRLILILAFLALGVSAVAQSLDRTQRLGESVVTAKVPKKLRTFVPFWGNPVPSDPARKDVVETHDRCVTGGSADNSYVGEPSGRAIPSWCCWNLDLASSGEDRNLFLPFVRGKVEADSLLWKAVVNECYRWAWSKPYGNTNMVCGPLYRNSGAAEPYAFYAVVCKKVPSGKPGDLGFRSVGFIVPIKSVPPIGNIYSLSTSVNTVEARSGYNFFPGLPRHIQEMIEEMTAYELFCPFQESEEIVLEDETVDVSADIFELMYDD